jgi:integrase
VRVVGPESVQLDFRWKDQRHRLRLRLAPTKANIEYCKRWKRKVEDEIALGTFVWEKHFPNHPNPLPDQSTLKLREFLLNYIKTLAGQIQPETIKEYEQCAEIVAAGLHDPPLEKATRAAFRTWISKQALSKNRIDNLLTPVRGAFRQALEDGTLNKNPLEGFQVRRIKTDTEKEIDPFTPQEVEALGRTKNGKLWTFWAWSGLRSGEIIGLLWRDVDDKSESVTVRRAVRRGREKTPKTGAGIRVLRLLAPAVDALCAIRPSGDDNGDLPVFKNPNTNAGWHEAKALNRAFARDCIKTKVRRRYVYQLRHTFATWALSSGENPAWIAKQMGHSDTAMLYKHYGKWMPQLDPKAGSRMLDAAQSKARNRQRAK